jgi:hypothetical protein
MKETGHQWDAMGRSTASLWSSAGEMYPTFDFLDSWKKDPEKLNRGKPGRRDGPAHRFRSRNRRPDHSSSYEISLKPEPMNLRSSISAASFYERSLSLSGGLFAPDDSGNPARQGPGKAVLQPLSH